MIPGTREGCSRYNNSSCSRYSGSCSRYSSRGGAPFQVLMKPEILDPIVENVKPEIRAVRPEIPETADLRRVRLL